jgi:PAS domain S-box-containing protein
MSKKILLVEDEVLIAMNEAQMLEKHGYEVVTAHKGDKAIEKVEEEPNISLILMDIDLGQGMDGTEAAQRILEKYDLPIAFLSSHTEPEVVEKTEGITSYGYIVKNSGETVILASIKMAFRLFNAKMKEKQNEQLLRESKERFKRIFETDDVAIALSRSEDGVYIEANPGFEKITGYSYNEIVGHSSRELEFMSVSYRENMASQLREYGYLKNQELTFPTKQGEMRKILFSISTIKLNEQDYLLAVMSDITERRKAEEHIERQNAFLSTVLDNIKEAIIICNEKGEIIRFNEAARRLHGLPEKPLPPESWAEYYDLYYPDGKTPLAIKDIPLFRALQGEDVNNVEIIVKPKKTASRLLSCSGKQIKDENGIKKGAVIAMHDITELNSSRDRYKRLVNSSPNLIMETDVDTHEILSCNPAMAKNLGSSIPEVVGREIDDFIPPNILQKRVEVSQRAIETGESQTLNNEQNGKSYHTTYIPIISEERRSIQTISIDITERKQAEKTLNKEKQKYKSLYDSIRDAILVVNKHREITNCNPAFTELFGYSLGEIQGKSTSILYASTREHRQVGELMEKHSNAPNFTYQPQFQKKSGEVFLGEKKIQCLKDENGESDGYIGIIRDISEQKMNTKKLEEMHSRLQKIIDYIPFVINEIDENGYYILSNEATSDFLGLSKEQLIGKHFKDVLPHDTANIFQKRIEELYATGKQLTVDDKFNINGEKQIYRTVLNPIYQDKSTIQSIVGIGYNVTDQLQALKDKENLMRELNHRVKNNLNMVSSLISLKDAETEDDLSDLKQRIDAIKLVHGKLHQYNKVECINVREYFQELLEAVFFSYSNRKVDIVNNVEEASIKTKTAIPLGLIVNEIATNAIKYGFTEDKDVRFTIDMSRETETNQYVLTLSNTGIPFPKDVSIEYPETMGLQLVSSLVNQLDGTMELQKEPNPVFTIRFPTEEE